MLRVITSRSKRAYHLRPTPSFELRPPFEQNPRYVLCRDVAEMQHLHVLSVSVTIIVNCIVTIVVVNHIILLFHLYVS
jgi:hypothetical protein